jgi:hypothetical protein
MGDVFASIGDYEAIPRADDALPRSELPNMDQVLEQIARDPEANLVLNAAQKAYTFVMVDNAINGATHDWEVNGGIENAVTPGSKVAAILTGAQADVAYEHAISDTNLNTYQKWTERSLNSVSDYMAKDLPFGGTAAAKIMDDITEAFFGDYTAEHEARAAHTGNKIINHGEITQEVIAVQAVDLAFERQGPSRWSESSRQLWRDSARDESLSAFNEQMSKMGRYYR